MVLGMLEVLVVLVVFVGGIFERVKSLNFFWGKLYNPKKLDGVGPVDNRPYTDKKLHVTHDM